jgi:5'-deoxynucleotidase YfbR-like HD superfamily hydrolase
MDNLSNLFKLIELTRSQPQYGYALNGIKQDELSNLAEHHYLVTFIAWQLTLHLQSKGASLDLARILEYSLIHDLGELLGGDIARPYAQANPSAKEKAKAFEAENIKFLSKFFGPHGKHFQKLSDEIEGTSNDESLIAKISDYIELSHYKFYMGMFTENDTKLIRSSLDTMTEKLKDQIAKDEIKDFINQWASGLPGKSTLEIISLK